MKHYMKPTDCPDPWSRQIDCVLPSAQRSAPTASHPPHCTAATCRWYSEGYDRNAMPPVKDNRETHEECCIVPRTYQGLVRFAHSQWKKDDSWKSQAAQQSLAGCSPVPGAWAGCGVQSSPVECPTWGYLLFFPVYHNFDRKKSLYHRIIPSKLEKQVTISQNSSVWHGQNRQKHPKMTKNGVFVSFRANPIDLLLKK